MVPNRDSGSQWDRVAAELRACREAQQRAWGDIDNTTLGRFLAGEVTSDEHQQIEAALDELPELRKLTDLVRDVLGESDVAVPEPASIPQTVPYGPAVLPFPQPKPQYRPAASTPAPQRAGRPWLRDAHFRQRAGLVAAAGLLLVLGFTLPRAGRTTSQAERSLAMSQPVATHVTAFEPDGRFLAANFAGNDMSAVFMKADNRGAGRAGEEESLLDRISASVQALETEGKTREAETLARQYASNLTRKALVYQEKGDLARAEPALNQACALCDRTLGPEAPESVRTRNSLAGVYEVALNTLPPSPYSAVSAGANPYLQQTTASLPRAVANESFRSDIAPPAPAAVPLERDTAHRPPPPAPRGSFPLRAHPVTMTAGTISHPKQAAKAAGTRMHHTYHAPHVPPMTATALRERLTRKTQSELRASVTPVLIKALREATTSAERQRLARALGQLGPAARDAVPLLIERYQQAGSASERVTLLAVFGDIGPAARQALPFVLDVVENVRDESPAAYTSARRSLAHLAPAARCRHHDKDNRERARGDSLARDVLQRIDSPEDRSGIVDEGECFSLHALRQSQDQIRRLAKTYQIEVLIETVPDKTLESEDDHKVLAGNGVYLCIHKEDVPRVQVYLSEALCKQGVTDAELRQVVEPHLRKHDYDRGLQAAVAFLADFEAKQAGK